VRPCLEHTVKVVISVRKILQSGPEIPVWARDRKDNLNMPPNLIEDAVRKK